MEQALPVGSSVCLECKICEGSGKAGLAGRQDAPTGSQDSLSPRALSAGL